MTIRRLGATAIAAILWLTICAPITANDELTRAKDLYRSAAYDETLSVLDTLTPAAGSTEAIEIYQYRIFCLVALDRKDEAKNAITALVTSAPRFQLSELEASPRVRTLFTDVRRSLLPSIIQGAYTDAKAAFDRKDPDAVVRFDHVVALLQDPDVAGNASLADLATVASGFRELSTSLASTAPAPAAPMVRAAAAPPANATVIQALTVSQALPAMQLRERREWDGEVEVVIDATGKVVSARMSKSLHPAYDPQILRAAKSWTYKPALRDGVPIQTVKVVAIHLDSRNECSGRVTSNCRPAGN